MKINKRQKKECIETNITFINTYLVLFFTIPLMIGATALLVIKDEMIIIIYIYLIIFILASIILTYLFSIKRIVNYFKVRIKKEIVHASVIGYSNDNIIINDKPAQIIELKIKENNKTIFYQTNETIQKYELNSEIELYNYDNLYLIKDDKINKKETILSIVVILILLPIITNFLVTFYVYYIMNTNYYDLKMLNIQNNNKEIMTKLNDLEYKIPEDYKLSSYEDNNYDFESKEDNHHCVIRVYSNESTQYNSNIETCDYYDINNRHVVDEQVVLNNAIWCHRVNEDTQSIHEKYYINNGKNYYSIDLYTYNDRDEKCTIDFSNFKKTIKLN